MDGKTDIQTSGNYREASNSLIKMNVALIILNSKYTKSEFPALPCVPKDGEMMEEMLKEYDDVKLVSNVDDILEEVKRFNQEQNEKGSKIGRMHFHFSGHGVHNARISIRADEKLKVSEVKTQTKITDTPTGECMVGRTGELYAIHDLKHLLLELGSETITATLDCCRSQSRSARTRGPSEEEVVKLRNREKISQENQEKMFVLYGSLDGHLILDDQSVTRELYRVTNEGKTNIAILSLARTVNNSWKSTGQRCKVDIVEVGENWENVYWPSNSESIVPAGTQTQEEHGSNSYQTRTDKNMSLPMIVSELQEKVYALEEKERKRETQEEDGQNYKKRKHE